MRKLTFILWIISLAVWIVLIILVIDKIGKVDPKNIGTTIEMLDYVLYMIGGAIIQTIFCAIMRHFEPAEENEIINVEK